MIFKSEALSQAWESLRESPSEENAAAFFNMILSGSDPGAERDFSKNLCDIYRDIEGMNDTVKSMFAEAIDHLARRDPQIVDECVLSIASKMGAGSGNQNLLNSLVSLMHSLVTTSRSLSDSQAEALNGVEDLLAKLESSDSVEKLLDILIALYKSNPRATLVTATEEFTIKMKQEQMSIRIVKKCLTLLEAGSQHTQLHWVNPILKALRILFGEPRLCEDKSDPSIVFRSEVVVRDDENLDVRDIRPNNEHIPIDEKLCTEGIPKSMEDIESLAVSILSRDRTTRDISFPVNCWELEHGLILYAKSRLYEEREFPLQKALDASARCGSPSSMRLALWLLINKVMVHPDLFLESTNGLLSILDRSMREPSRAVVLLASDALRDLFLRMGPRLREREVFHLASSRILDVSIAYMNYYTDSDAPKYLAATLVNIFQALEVALFYDKGGTNFFHVRTILVKSPFIQPVRKFSESYFVTKFIQIDRRAPKTDKRYIFNAFFEVLNAIVIEKPEEFSELVAKVGRLLERSQNLRAFFDKSGFPVFIKEIIFKDGIHLPEFVSLLALVKSYGSGSHEAIYSFESTVGYSRVSETAKKFIVDLVPDKQMDALRNTMLEILLGDRHSTEIRNVYLIVPLFELSLAEETFFHTVVRLYNKLCSESRKTLGLCSKAGLGKAMIIRFRDFVEISGDVREQYLNLLTMLCGYSVSVAEVKALFKLLRPMRDMSKPRWFEDIISVIHTSIAREIEMSSRGFPTDCFDFAEETSHLSINNLPYNLWPSRKAYSVATWMLLDTSNTRTFISRVFSFFNESGHGVELCISVENGRLVSIARSVVPGDASVVKTDLPVNPGEYFFIVFTHRSTRKSGNFKMYINAELVGSGTLHYPPRGCGPFTENKIGGIVESRSQSKEFSIQVSYFLVLPRELSTKEVSSLYNDGTLPEQSVLSKLDPTILLQPQACDDDFNCRNQSQRDELLVQVNNVVRVTVNGFMDTIYCIGGLRVFYPLILISDESLVEILKIIGKILAHFGGMYKEEFLHRKGFRMISYLLKQINISESLGLEVFYLMAGMFDTIKDKDIQFNMLYWFFLDFELWTSIPITRSDFVETIFRIMDEYNGEGNLLSLSKLSDIYIVYLWDEEDYFSKNIEGRKWSRDVVTNCSKKFLDYLSSALCQGSESPFDISTVLGDLLMYSIITQSRQRKTEILRLFLGIFEKDCGIFQLEALGRYLGTSDVMNPFAHILLDSEHRVLTLKVLFYIHKLCQRSEAVSSDFYRLENSVLGKVISRIPLDEESKSILLHIAAGAEAFTGLAVPQDSFSEGTIAVQIVFAILISIARNGQDVTEFLRFLNFVDVLTLDARNARAVSTMEYFRILSPRYINDKEATDAIVRVLTKVILSGFEMGEEFSCAARTYFEFFARAALDKQLPEAFVELVGDSALRKSAGEPYEYLVLILHLEPWLFGDPSKVESARKTSIVKKLYKGFPYDITTKPSGVSDIMDARIQSLSHTMSLFTSSYQRQIISCAMKIPAKSPYSHRFYVCLCEYLNKIESPEGAGLKSVGIVRDSKSNRYVYKKAVALPLDLHRRVVRKFYFRALYTIENSSESKDNGSPDSLDSVISDYTAKTGELLERLKIACENSESDMRREWYSLSAEIVTERGPFELWNLGQTQKWKLDTRETRSRMRLLLERNVKFDSHFDASRRRDRRVTDSSKTPDSDSPQENSGLGSLLTARALLEIKKSKSLENAPAEDDLISVVHGIIRIKPLKKIEGTLKLYKDRIVYTEKERDKTHLLKMDDIREIHQRRYLFRWVSFEIFMTNGSTYLFAFVKGQTKLVNKMLDTFFLQESTGAVGKVPIVSGFEQIDRFTLSFMSFFDKLVTFSRSGTVILIERNGYLRPLHGEQQYKLEYQKRLWLDGKISTFDYLIFLNTISGRSFNNLSQYPVFPWVVVDFESDELDLKSESTFRDFSRPIAAMLEKRRAEAILRYETIESDIRADSALTGGESQGGTLQQFPFHFGSHYSSPGVVLYYLIRMEPYTSSHIQLQDNKFDVADRLFFSISRTLWNIINGTDNKELIPEFFYQPEFLYNSSEFDLGIRQDGRKVDDVQLPPWANGSAVEFIIKHRMALESWNTRKSLHKWIDLIFGVNSRGEGAKKSINVLYPLSYEETLGFNRSLQTSEFEDAWIDSYLENFGQTPTQLFWEPHPACAVAPLLATLSSEDEIVVLSPSRNDKKGVSGAIGFQHVIESKGETHPDVLVAVTSEWQILECKIRYKKSRVTVDLISRIQDKWEASNEFFPSSKSAALYVSGGKGGSRWIITCGYWDRSVRAHNIGNSNHEEVFTKVFHKDIVTCLSVDGEMLVSGGRDTLCILWSVDRLNKSMNLECVYRGHDDEVTCLDIDADLGVFVSGSADGTLIVNSIVKRKYIRTIGPSNGGGSAVVLVKILSLGYILSYHRDGRIRMHTINGRFYKEIHMEHPVLDWVVTGDESRLLVLTEDSSITEIEIPILKIKKKRILTGKALSILVLRKAPGVFISNSNGSITYIPFTFEKGI